MTETAAETAAPAATGTPKAAKKGKATAGSKKAKTAPSHPPVSQMVNAAIKSLKERGGSSTQAIKKYISSTYKIDAEKKSQFIRKYLKSAVASGALVQTKGKGASGSFKLAGSGESKSAAAPKVKKAGGAKPAGRPKGSKNKSPAKKAAAPAAPKAKKTKKPPTAAKSPKPKVAKAKPASTPKAKKAAAPKKAKKPAAKKASPKKK